MYRITTRTGRIVRTEIISLNNAINALKLLEFKAKRSNIYSPGYYRIEKYDEKPSKTSEKIQTQTL